MVFTNQNTESILWKSYLNSSPSWRINLKKKTQKLKLPSATSVVPQNVFGNSIFQYRNESERSGLFPLWWLVSLWRWQYRFPYCSGPPFYYYWLVEVAPYPSRRRVGKGWMRGDNVCFASLTSDAHVIPTLRRTFTLYPHRVRPSLQMGSISQAVANIFLNNVRLASWSVLAAWLSVCASAIFCKLFAVTPGFK